MKTSVWWREDSTASTRFSLATFAGPLPGADRNKPGLFSEANSGTLFLDEIGETSPSLQV